MPRRQKKYHIIYKTTCLVNGKFYIGMHSTDNLDDGYMGSGRKLGYSFKRFGKDKHITKILEYLPNRKALSNREREIVNENLIKSKMCMNIVVGGEGGPGGLFGKEHAYKFHAAGGRKVRQMYNKINAERMKSDPEFRKKVVSAMKESYEINGHPWTGRTHSEETKEKMRKPKNQGTKNSQYGSKWITNGTDNKKINKDATLPEDWWFGRTLARVD